MLTVNQYVELLNNASPETLKSVSLFVLLTESDLKNKRLVAKLVGYLRCLNVYAIVLPDSTDRDRIYQNYENSDSAVANFEGYEENQTLSFICQAFHGNRESTYAKMSYTPRTGAIFAEVWPNEYRLLQNELFCSFTK